MEDVQKKLLTKSKRAKMEQRGKFISFLCIALIVAVVVSIFYFVASKGLATFFKDKINVFDFLFGTNWNPSDIGADGKPMVGALPMIAGSFIVTFLSAIVATPFAIGAAVFMTEISPKKGAKFLQPVIELLVGIPSVVYGFIGLSVIVPFVRSIFGGTGFGILAGTFVLFVMILPGEALAIQMVIGNAAVMPTSLTTPASTLTSILTMGIGNTIMGTVENNVLWSLALILLLMSLLFNIVIRIIGKRGALK